MKITDEIQEKIDDISDKYWDEGQNIKSDFIDALRELCDYLPNVTGEPPGPAARMKKS